MSDEAAEDLTSILTRKLLQRLAGHRSFERGEVYSDDGAVRSLRRQGGRIRAVVRGTHDYHVQLWVEGGEIFVLGRFCFDEFRRVHAFDFEDFGDAESRRSDSVGLLLLLLLLIVVALPTAIAVVFIVGTAHWFA